MDTRLIRSHPLFLPLLISIISLLGICVIIASVWFPRQNAQVFPTRTPTPFKYLLLATETVIPTPAAELARPPESRFAATGTSDIADPETTFFSIATAQTGIFTGEIFIATSTITPNPIFAESQPMNVGTYDAADKQIIRRGSWIIQNNIDAYQGNLLVSNTVGDYVAFRFIGYQMMLGYQSNEIHAGELLVNIDGAEVTLTQAVGNLWISDELNAGTHFVIVTHAGGATVNLDYVDILD
jgi:hypothetical protein